MLLRLSDRRLVGLALLALAAGCGDSVASFPALPGTLVGESAHFRLFVSPEFPISSVPAYLQGKRWPRRARGRLGRQADDAEVPEGQRKIDYHLLTYEQITAGCLQDASGCELDETLQIATIICRTNMSYACVHAARRARGRPCHSMVAGSRRGDRMRPAGWRLPDGRRSPWEQAVMSSNDQGGLFARYLIRTQGIDAFVRYYQQAPGRRDPALFAANFSAFWNLNIDDAWTAMHTVGPARRPSIRRSVRARCRRCRPTVNRPTATSPATPTGCCRTPGARPWHSSRPPAGPSLFRTAKGSRPSSCQAIRPCRRRIPRSRRSPTR